MRQWFPFTFNAYSCKMSFLFKEVNLAHLINLIRAASDYKQVKNIVKKMQSLQHVCLYKYEPVIETNTYNKNKHSP
jgi:hypothetical protein